MARRVVIVPGRTFGPYVPQTFLPAMAAVRCGAEIAAVEWNQPELIMTDDPRDTAARVLAQAESALAGSDPAETVVVAKSLGSYAAARVVELGLPAIWVTPLLNQPLIVDALARSRAPTLLVGGTADAWWNGAIARSLPAQVVELPGADHGLFVPGPLTGSVTNLGLLATAAETFLDQRVWPVA